jgi:ribosomal protein L11 methyltransferase
MPPPKEGWQRSRVLALFHQQEARRRPRRCCRRRTSSPARRCSAVEEVPEQDWVRLTQSQFAPVEITPEFWIVPTWHEPPARPAR